MKSFILGYRKLSKETFLIIQIATRFKKEVIVSITVHLSIAILRGEKKLKITFKSNLSSIVKQNMMATMPRRLIMLSDCLS